jgi:endoglucanase
VNGTRVWLADNNGYVATGRLARTRIAKSGWAIERAEVQLDRPLDPRPAADKLFGGFGFRAPVWRSGKKLYTKAADDLVGVFAILSTAIDMFGRHPKTAPPFIGLLTRGEEVGFVGAVAHFELGWLKAARRPVVCVSLETSRTLPGAIVGKGPVVRLGDRRTVFHPDGLRVLSELAERVLPGAHQRRIMDGGACEATAATAYGIPAIGLSVPLGNYHNQNLEGGPGTRGRHGSAPEFVDVRDIAGLLRLCRSLMRARLPWDDAWATQRRRLRGNLRSYRKHL